MKNQLILSARRIFSAVALMTAFAVPSLTSSAQNAIGINFAGRQWSIGGANPQSLSYTDTAGAVGQQNWNNVDLGGHDSGGTAQIVGPNAGVISDNSGTATGLTFSYSAQGMWAMNQAAGLTGNQQLMNGYSDVESAANATNIFGNITYSSYDVYVYVSSDGNGRIASVSINGGAPYYLTTAASGYNFSNPLIQGAATTKAGATNGHYVCFSNVSGSNLEIVVTRDTSNVGIAGVQIVDSSITVYPPSFAAQPVPEQLYAGATARFSVLVAGTAPFSYKWQKNGVNLTDGGNISGSTSNVLTLSNISAANAGSYSVVVTNIAGPSSSAAVQLDVMTPVNAYELTILSNTPAAYYRLNETGDSVSTPNLPAFDLIAGLNGIYGGTVLDANPSYGIQGPKPSDGFPGFETENGAALFAPGYATSQITIPSLGFSTNSVTFAAWIYPAGVVAPNAGLVYNRGANVAGLSYSGSTDVNGNYTLGYTWNNDGGTYGWNSGLVPPVGQWSFVALVVTPTDATIYLANVNGIASSVHTYSHAIQTFSGPIAIGNDPAGANGTRVFNGSVDEVAVFKRALTQSQIIALFSSASGLANFPPTIAVQPDSQAPYAQETAHFSVSALGTQPLTYQWQVGTNGVYVNLADGGRISGATSSTLTISNVSASDPTNYIVIIKNLFGTVTSSPASLTVTASSYANAVLATSPIAYYALNEAGDPASGNLTAYDYVGGFNGIYGSHVKNGNTNYGVAGPQTSDGFPDFPANNAAAQIVPNDGSGHVTVTPWTLNTNAVTFTAWIRPNGVEPSWSGIVFCRASGMAAGLNFNGSTDASGNRILSYTWGDYSGWNSQLAPPTNQWSFVALVITPTNATIYMINANGTKSTMTASANAIQRFAGTAVIGCDPFDLSGRNFNGSVDEVALFNRSLSSDEIIYLYTHATGVGLPPQITMLTPSPVGGYPGLSATFTASVIGSGPFTYKWYRGTTLLNDGSNISGASTLSLTITNVTGSDAGDYTLVVTGSAGSATSTVSTLNVGVVPSTPYHSTILAANPTAYWRLNETSGTIAHDMVGGHDGTYGSAMQLGAAGQESAGMFGVATDTAAARFTRNTDQSWVTVPALNLNTNTVTIMAWVYPTLRPDNWSGIFLTKSSSAGLTFRDNTPNTLGMMWNNGDFWYLGTSLSIPVNQWSLVAMSVQPTNATLYVMNSSGTNSWVNNTAMNVEPWSGTARIGNDSYGINLTFNGSINEVAVFNRTLTGTELGSFYSAATTAQSAPISLQIQKDGANVKLVWTGGTLVGADSVNGTWTAVANAVSPYPLVPTGTNKFYRVMR